MRTARSEVSLPGIENHSNCSRPISLLPESVALVLSVWLPAFKGKNAITASRPAACSVVLLNIGKVELVYDNVTLPGEQDAPFPGRKDTLFALMDSLFASEIL